MNSVSNTHNRESENIAYFDRWATRYDDGRISSWFQYTQNLVISLMTLRRDSKVLDVGCGTGYAVRRLGSMLSEGRACGIDISSQMIRQAVQKIPGELASRVEFRVANSAEIPYPDGYFDNLLCTNSFHHYPDPIKALKEMQRAVRPGGEIMILDNAPDLSWYTWCWDRVLRLIETGHVRYYPSHELGELLRRSGMEDVRLRYLKNEFLKHGKLFASLQVWSGGRPPAR